MWSLSACRRAFGLGRRVWCDVGFDGVATVRKGEPSKPGELGAGFRIDRDPDGISAGAPRVREMDRVAIRAACAPGTRRSHGQVYTTWAGLSYQHSGGHTPAPLV